jgi:hypothetical protein
VFGLVLLDVSNQILRNAADHSSNDVRSPPRKPEPSVVIILSFFSLVLYIPVLLFTSHITIWHLYDFDKEKPSTFLYMQPPNLVHRY